MPRPLLAAASAVLALAVAACGDQHRPEPGIGAAPDRIIREAIDAGSEGPTRPTPPVPTSSVTISDYAYRPQVITVPRDTTVRFSNGDGVAHTATATDNTFDSGIIPVRGIGSFTASTPGTYDFYCRFHPVMKGRIVVK